jgi:hypothetical protein
MKRFLSFLALCAFLWPLLQSAQGADVSVNLFYDNLSGGNWYEVADYGYVWQPDVATNESWRPYTDGYWAYTDQGWTWVSYEDFGWATYHYGRWARLADYGWVWVPGTEWAPAWVSWRTGGDYVGWAPLPPAGGGEAVYESRPITGHVDVEFGIGPAYYNFVDLRYIGEPVLRDRIVDYNQNVTIVNNTVNVTNITYNNSTVYSYGPDYAVVSRYSIRPIQRLKLQRHTVDPAQAIRNGSITKVQGNTLVVAAPQKLQKVAGAQIAPKQVKARIEQPKVEKGWANTDPGEKAKLEQKFKAENVKNVAKPDIQPRVGNAAMAPANANQNAVATSPAGKPGKGNRKGERAASAPAATTAAGASPNAIEQQGRAGKNKNRVERGQQLPETSAPPAAENPPAKAEPGNARRNKANTRDENIAPSGEANATRNERNGAKAKPESPNAAPARENDQRASHSAEQGEQAMKQRQENQRETQQRQPQQPEAQQHTNQAQQREMQQGRAQQHQAQQREASPQRQTPQREAPPRAQERPQQKPPAANPAVSGAAGEKRQPREGAQGTPQGQPQKNGQGEPRKGKGKKNEGEATPSPQQDSSKI